MTERECPRCDPHLKKCWQCGHRGPWRITMDCDHLAARCTHCGTGYDIGHSPRGFDPEETPGALADRNA